MSLSYFNYTIYDTSCIAVFACLFWIDGRIDTLDNQYGTYFSGNKTKCESLIADPNLVSPENLRLLLKPALMKLDLLWCGLHDSLTRMTNDSIRIAVHSLLILEYYRWRILQHPTDGSEDPFRGLKLIVVAERIE